MFKNKWWTSCKTRKKIIEFKNYFKQLPVLFKVYANFECILGSVESSEGSCTKKYQDHIPCNFTYKPVCLDHRFSKPIVVYRGEDPAYKFIEAILKEFNCCKKVMKTYFNTNLIMTEKEEEQFQLSNVLDLWKTHWRWKSKRSLSHNWKI